MEPRGDLTAAAPAGKGKKNENESERQIAFTAAQEKRGFFSRLGHALIKSKRRKNEMLARALKKALGND